MIREVTTEASGFAALTGSGIEQTFPLWTGAGRQEIGNISENKLQVATWVCRLKQKLGWLLGDVAAVCAGR